MKSLRYITVLVLLAFAAGPALLDRCLVSCHDEAPAQAAVPPCHDAGAHDGLSVSGVGACSHDHDGLSAEGVSDVRQAGSVHVSLLAVLPPRFAVAPTAAASAINVGPGSSHQLSPLPLDLPLRL